MDWVDDLASKLYFSSPVNLALVLFKAIVMLLLIQCSLLNPLFVGLLYFVLVLFCFVVLSAISCLIELVV